MAAVLTAAAILTGCRHHDDEPVSESPLLLSADTQATRATSPLANQYNDFGVWAWKTDPDNNLSIVLARASAADPGTEYYTRLSAGNWDYVYSDADATQYLRYWDRAATNYYFTAYAPYKQGDVVLNTTHSISTSITHTASSTSTSLSISPVNGNVTADTGIDWLEARWHRQITPTLIDIDLIADKDHHTANLTYKVPLTFHHIMSAIEFRIYSGMDNFVVLKNVSITLDDAIYTQADYIEDAWTNLSTPSTSLFTMNRNLEIVGTDKENPHTLATLLQIPQDVSTNRVTVHVTLSDDSERSCSFYLEQGWQREIKYIYYLYIHGEEIILMDFTADPWDFGDEIEVTDPVVNW